MVDHGRWSREQSCSEGTNCWTESESPGFLFVCLCIAGFHREHKWGLNTYLYAPKDDYKHRMYWRDLYSAEEAGELRRRTTSNKLLHISLSILSVFVSRATDHSYISSKGAQHRLYLRYLTRPGHYFLQPQRGGLPEEKTGSGRTLYAEAGGAAEMIHYF